MVKNGGIWDLGLHPTGDSKGVDMFLPSGGSLLVYLCLASGPELMVLE